ncbi:MAG: type II secretion system minor pseudopilin GspJ [Gammaproteobacteria bacterium]|nr:type II secretion system minor pseudopilin GspJ [Gammaproteobacteria bacterium]
MDNRYSRGLTLIELLIALAIFAVLSAMAHGAIRAALEARERIEDQAARLGALQKAITVMERDISQMVHRSIRDENGEPLPALVSPGSTLDSALSGKFRLMEFTRTGWQNPTGAKRGHLRRIAYEIDDKRLLRLAWHVLDRAQDSLPLSSVLLTQVNAVEIRYLGADNQWQTEWPPQRWGQETPLPNGDLSEGGLSGGGLPKGIEVTLDIPVIGRIRRLLVVSY